MNPKTNRERLCTIWHGLATTAAMIILCCPISANAETDGGERLFGEKKLYNGSPAVEFSYEHKQSLSPEIGFLVGRASMPATATTLQYQVFCNGVLAGTLTSSVDDAEIAYKTVEGDLSSNLSYGLNNITIVSPTREYPRVYQTSSDDPTNREVSDIYSTNGDAGGVDMHAVELNPIQPFNSVEVKHTVFSSYYLETGETLFVLVGQSPDDYENVEKFAIDIVPVTANSDFAQFGGTTRVSQVTTPATAIARSQAYCSYTAGIAGEYMVVVRPINPGVTLNFSEVDVTIIGADEEDLPNVLESKDLTSTTNYYQLSFPADDKAHFIFAKGANRMRDNLMLFVVGGISDYGRVVGFADSSKPEQYNQYDGYINDPYLSQTYYFPTKKIYIINTGSSSTYSSTANIYSDIGGKTELKSPAQDRAAKKAVAQSHIQTASVKDITLNLGGSCEFNGLTPDRVATYSVNGNRCCDLRFESGTESISLHSMGINKTGYYILVLYSNDEIVNIQKIQVQ